MTFEEWRIILDSKLDGAFHMVRNALPYMLEQKYGPILNASSIGWLGLQGMSSYGAAFAGIWSFTRAIAQDLMGTGITVNSYAPNAKTRSWYSMLATYRSQGIEAEAIEEGAPAAMRFTADIFAPFFAYLASDQSAGITGYQFQTGADGQIGLWSEPEVCKDIWAEEGKPWELKDLEIKIPELLGIAKKAKTSIELH